MDAIPGSSLSSLLELFSYFFFLLVLDQQFISVTPCRNDCLGPCYISQRSLQLCFNVATFFIIFLIAQFYIYFCLKILSCVTAAVAGRELSCNEDSVYVNSLALVHLCMWFLPQRHLLASKRYIILSPEPTFVAQMHIRISSVISMLYEFPSFIYDLVCGLTLNHMSSF